MSRQTIGGAEIDLSLLDPMDPVLDIAPVDPNFTTALVHAGHFVFSVIGDPMAAPWRMSGMACPKRVITSRARAGTTIYSCKDGASWKIKASDVETCVSARIEYVRALDLTSFGNEVGVEQWGIIRLNGDADELLTDWPGAISKEISLTWAESATLSFEAKNRVGEWYEWASETLLVQRGFVR